MDYERKQEDWGVEFTLPTNPKEVNVGSGSGSCSSVVRLDLRRRVITYRRGQPSEPYDRIEVHGISKNGTWYRPLEMDLETAAAVHEILGKLLYEEKMDGNSEG